MGDYLFLFRNSSKFRGMNAYTDLFKIETNHLLPMQGRVLIAEPFLYDFTFGRTVILLIEHTKEGSMGLILNKSLPLLLNDIVSDFNGLEDMPLYKGGPLCTDTLFYLHTLPNVPDAISIGKGFYLNGSFNAIKDYLMQGNQVKGKIRFFLGYSGWGYKQLQREMKENTWLVGKENITSLMDEERVEKLWKNAIGRLGGKYEIWSRFPQIPSLN